MKYHLTHSSLAALLFVLPAIELPAQTTAFTYQGQLQVNGSPANGLYDLTFEVFDADTNGTSFGVVTNAATDVGNGLFMVALDYGSGVFDGSQRWLEIGAVTNGGGTSEVLTPRQPITSTPYAIKAGGVDAVAIMGTISPTSIGPGTFTGNFLGGGSALTTLDASELATGAVPLAALDNAWKTTGNAGTTAGINFLGTTDSAPLDLRVNNTRAMRIESTGGTPNLIGGHSGNTIGSGSVGAVIAGGGASVFSHSIGAGSDYSSIGGGLFNSIASNSAAAIIAGGGVNYIGVGSDLSTIGGGLDNAISNASPYSVIAGGTTNSIGFESDFSVIGGGHHNNIASSSLTATIGGGRYNNIASSSYTATIGGGFDNNIASNSFYATIGGGRGNNIVSDSPYSTIGGGFGNDIESSGFSATIGGGFYNNIASNSFYATIGGGSANDIASSQYATIGGGAGNDIASNSFTATIGGGNGNHIASSAPYASIPGGGGNDIGAGASYAFAAGRQAKANHAGSFVWGDSQDENVVSTITNQVVFRAQNGMRLTEDAGSAAAITVGDRYRDNALLAWGKVSSGGSLLAGFGVSSVTYHAAGDYEIFLTDTAASVHSIVPVAMAEIDTAPTSASTIRIVSINQDGSNANRFKVYINNGNYALVDNEFVFMVTAR